jgi:hypothetical protein
MWPSSPVAYKCRVDIIFGISEIVNLYRLFQVDVFRVVMLCSVVVGHQRFGGTCSLHLHSTRHHNPEDLDLKYHRRESLKTRIIQTDLCHSFMLIYSFRTWRERLVKLLTSVTCISFSSSRLFLQISLTLKWIFKKQSVKEWSGKNDLKIRFDGRMLWIQY